MAGYTFKRITQEQYNNLRQRGVSRDEIIKMDSETSVDKLISTATKVADFIGAKGVYEQYGASAAQALAKPEARGLVEFPKIENVVGSALQTGSLLVPGGQATLPARAAAGAASGYMFDVGSKIQEGKPLGEAAVPGMGTAIGATLPIVGKIIGKGTELLGKTAKNVAGAIGGKGTKVIDEVLADPKAALEGLRGQASLQGNAQKVRGTVSLMARDASDEFGKALEELPKRIGRNPETLKAGQKTTISVDGKTFELSLQGVKSKLTQALKQFNVAFDPKTKTFDFLEAPLDTAETKRLEEVFSVIDNWRDTSPVGFNNLARKISNFRKAGEQSRELNTIIDTVSRNVRNYIGDRIPASREMLRKFSAAQDIIEAFDQEFATSGSYVGGTAERIQTERKIANLFSGEKESTLELLKSQVPGGSGIAASEAGRELAGGISRSGSAIGDLLRSAIQTVITPKAVGEIVARTGIAEPKARALLETLGKLEAPARGAVIDFIASLFEGQTTQR